MEASRNALAAEGMLSCAANRKCTGPRSNGTVLPIPCRKKSRLSKAADERGS